MKTKFRWIALILITSLNLQAAFVVGEYDGDGNSTQAISGLGFQPTTVLVKGDGLDAWIATSSMTSGDAKLLTGTSAPQTGLISTIDSDGFTVASTSNASSVKYYYAAWDNVSADVGSFTPAPDSYNSSSTYFSGSIVLYSGSYYKSNTWVNANESPATHSSKWDSISLTNVVSGTNINVGYRPKMVWGFGEGTTWYDVGPGQFVLDGDASDESSHFNNGTSLAAEKEIVNDLTALGFQFNTPGDPGVDNGIVKGVLYHYVTFPASSILETGTYTGNATDDHKVTTSNEPDFLLVKDFEGGQNPRFKTSVMWGAKSYLFRGAEDTDAIKSLETDGFTLGVDGEVNLSSRTFQYLSFYGATVLPVELMSFNASRKGEKNILTWKTALEVNSSHFEVQRSTNGKDFETIDVVEAAGNSSLPISYNAADLFSDATKIYYRLKIVDLDGSFDYSKIVQIPLNMGRYNVQVYPNPVNNNLNVGLSLDVDQQLVFTIYNQVGQVVHQSQINANAGFEAHMINTSPFSKGTYSLVVSGNSSFESITKKFVK